MGSNLTNNREREWGGGALKSMPIYKCVCGWVRGHRFHAQKRSLNKKTKNIFFFLKGFANLNNYTRAVFSFKREIKIACHRKNFKQKFKLV